MSRRRLAVSSIPEVFVPHDEAERAVRATFPVALVSMPFGPPHMPSMQIGLLASISRLAGFPTDALHLCLDFASRVGPRQYHAVAQQGSEFANWLFAEAAFGSETPEPDGPHVDDYVNALAPALADPSAAREWIWSTRQGAPAFIDEMVDQVDWGRYGAVGFSITYQQKTAAFGLARRMKERWPDVHIVFGGAHFDAPMGGAWMEAVPWIDFGVEGEADLALPELLVALAGGGDPLLVPGVLARDSRQRVVTGPPPQPLEDLDWLPVPDYDDFFDRAERLGLLRPGTIRDVEIPFEAARGCWWGEKNHCTFCGIKDELLRYRHKSASVVEAELVAQVKRYRSFKFLNTDLIMDLGHLDELLGSLAAAGTDLSFWWEIKASLTRDQVRKLRDGGLHTVQPGIESLDSHSLRLMQKGTRAATNVNLLRWCAHYGIDVKWNRIHGFPGETDAGLASEADLVRSLHHLIPPGRMFGISIDRFSPMFEDQDRFPRSSFRPPAEYASVYPPTVDFERAAFTFDTELDDVLPQGSHDALIAAYAEWGQASIARPRPRLTAARAPGVVHIDDRRRRGAWRTHRLHGMAAAVYQACFDAPRSPRQIVGDLATDDGTIGPAVEAVQDELDQLVADGMVMRDGSVFLALALPATPHR